MVLVASPKTNSTHLYASSFFFFPPFSWLAEVTEQQHILCVFCANIHSCTHARRMHTYFRTHHKTLCMCVYAYMCSLRWECVFLMNERHSLLALVVSLRLLLLLFLSCLAGLCAVTGHLEVEKELDQPVIINSIQANYFFIFFPLLWPVSVCIRLGVSNSNT